MATTTIGAPGVTFPDATVQASAGATGIPVLNVYTSPGTYTKPASVKAIKVTVVGGGGNGGGTTYPGGTSSTWAVTAGGGAGGISVRVYPAASLPGPQPYTVGAATGTSSFGLSPVSVITATGGSTAPTVAVDANGGGYALGAAGGAGSGGQLNIPGSQGGSVIYSGGAPLGPLKTGTGASTLYGAGGAGFNYSSSPSGPSSTSINSGTGYGSGGSGLGFNVGNVSTPRPAINNPATGGAAGVVIVEEFY